MKGLSFYIAIGKWGGFNIGFLSGPIIFRIVLGWFAFVIMSRDVDVMLHDTASATVRYRKQLDKAEDVLQLCRIDDLFTSNGEYAERFRYNYKEWFQDWIDQYFVDRDKRIAQYMYGQGGLIKKGNELFCPDHKNCGCDYGDISEFYKKQKV
jgi:hypothetical protein